MAAAATHNVATARTCGHEETGRRRLPGDLHDDGEAVILTSPRVEVVRTEGFDPGTRDRILDLWCAKNDAGGAMVALGFWQRPVNPLLHHRRSAYRVMTDPARRGRNLGRLLMAAMHRVAREDGVEIGELGVRGGMAQRTSMHRSGGGRSAGCPVASGSPPAMIATTSR